MHAVVLDGEVVAFGEDGRPSFARLQHRLHLADPKEARRRAAADPVHFVAFDLLYVDGRSLLADPYDERRARLESSASPGPTSRRPSASATSPGRDVLRAVTENGLEGVVAKRRDSTYRPGRRVADWVKVKVVTTQEVVVGGWTEGKGGRGEPGRPAARDPRRGRPASTSARSAPGSTTGPSIDHASSCARCVADQSLRRTITATEAKGAHFVRPSLVGEVGYGEWTPAGRLRHPTWRGLRPDKTPADVEPRVGDLTGRAGRRRSTPPATSPSATSPKSGSQHVRVGDRELSVTNLDKVLFPEIGLHQGAAHRLLRPHRRGDAAAPRGATADHEALSRRRGREVLLREARALARPRWVKTLTVPSERQGEITYAMVPDLPTLAWAANLGTIEFHVPLWLRRGAASSRPTPTTWSSTSTRGKEPPSSSAAPWPGSSWRPWPRRTAPSWPRPAGRRGSSSTVRCPPAPAGTRSATRRTTWPAARVRAP